MLASSSDYDYLQRRITAPSSTNFNNILQAPGSVYSASDERPKLYDMPNIHSDQGIHEYPYVNTSHTNIPSQTYPFTEVDHEPLILSMHQQTHYYPTLNATTLTAHNEYTQESSEEDGCRQTSDSCSIGFKRSREELNLKEKKRMLKLNDRINQLKEVLDEAGVQSKKNKQSVLDNTFHYVEKLRNSVLIHTQKAIKAEKLANEYKVQLEHASHQSQDIYRTCFERSTLPRVVFRPDKSVQAFNTAFLAHTGLDAEQAIHENMALEYMCADSNQLHEIMNEVLMEKTPKMRLVQASRGAEICTMALTTSAIVDSHSNIVSGIEMCLAPVDSSSLTWTYKRSPSDRN